MKRNWLLTLTIATAMAMVGFAIAAVTPASAISTNIVIGEFRTRGPAGGNDEFIELYNLSSVPVNISGWRINGSSSTGVTTTRATIPNGVTLGAYQHYLMANTAASGYSGSATPNLTYTTGIVDNGGIAIVDTTNVIIDQVGMSATSAYREGTTLTQTTTSIQQSYARQPNTLSQVGGYKNGVDTDSNIADFIYNNGSSSPENLTSPLAIILSDLSASTPAASPAPVVFGALGLVAAALLLRRQAARTTSN
ncbi:MAG: lamin tail domain-containing protein [Thermoflexales bacterium]|nr:lamin tail domain-containing protein [Thermoflexales bacterium]